MLLSGAGAGACQDWTGSTTLDETEKSQGNHNNIMLIPFFRYMENHRVGTPWYTRHRRNNRLATLSSPTFAFWRPLVAQRCIKLSWSLLIKEIKHSIKQLVELNNVSFSICSSAKSVWIIISCYFKCYLGRSEITSWHSPYKIQTISSVICWCKKLTSQLGENRNVFNSVMARFLLIDWLAADLTGMLSLLIRLIFTPNFEKEKTVMPSQSRTFLAVEALKLRESRAISS